MAKNDFKAFATGKNANVMSQEEWEALPALLSGFTAGKASSAQVNKAIRQASFIAAALAQYTANKSGLDVLDDGDLNGFIIKMTTAFGKDFQALDATLTALASLTGAANKLPYFNGNDTMALTGLTDIGRTVIGSPDAGAVQNNLGFSFNGTINSFVSKGPGLLIKQGGKVTAPDGTGNSLVINFPIAFPNGCVDCFAIFEDGVTNQTPFEISIVPENNRMTVFILSTGGSVFFNNRSLRWMVEGF